MEIKNKKYDCEFVKSKVIESPICHLFVITVFTLAAINRRESNINYLLQEIGLYDIDLHL